MKTLAKYFGLVVGP